MCPAQDSHSRVRVTRHLWRANRSHRCRNEPQGEAGLCRAQENSDGTHTHGWPTQHWCGTLHSAPETWPATGSLKPPTRCKCSICGGCSFCTDNRPHKNPPSLRSARVHLRRMGVRDGRVTSSSASGHCGDTWQTWKNMAFWRGQQNKPRKQNHAH